MRALLLGAALLLPAAAEALDRHSDLTVLLANAKRLQRCYERALTYRPGVRGRVVLQLDIAETGVVTRATTTSSTLDDPTLERCLASAAATTRFPAGPARHREVPIRFVAPE